MADMYAGGAMGISNAACVPIDLKADLELEQLMGSWYMYKQSVSFPYGRGSTCGTSYYTKLDSSTNDFYAYINAMKNDATPDQELVEMNGAIKCSNYESGRCYLELPYALAPPAHYDILDTDYTSYLITWSCQGMISANNWIWIYTRDPLTAGSYAFTQMENKLNPILTSKFDDYDPSTMLLDVNQDSSCKYNPLIGN